MTVPKSIIDRKGNKNNFKNNVRTIDAQILPKRKNIEPQPQFTGSYKKKKRVCIHYTTCSMELVIMNYPIFMNGYVLIDCH